MTGHGCTVVQEQLGPFIDGELTGAERLEVLRHLDRCGTCASELSTLHALGDTVRAIVPGSDPHMPELAGLAGGVVSRSRAEADLSWRAWFERASEDWHWVIVGAGSLTATLVSALLLSAILAFGPEPERRDSLAGMITHLQAPDVVLAYATPLPINRDIVLLSAADEPPLSRADPSSARYWPELEAHLVKQLVWTVTRNSHERRLENDPTSRLIQEALLEEITRIRLGEPMMVGRPASTRIAVSSAISWEPVLMP